MAPVGARPRANAYRLFLAGMASWFTAWGLRSVMVQWLVVHELGVSVARVGTAQMALPIACRATCSLREASTRRYTCAS
jgi:hypothetical protein